MQRKNAINWGQYTFGLAYTNIFNATSSKTTISNINIINTFIQGNILYTIIIKSTANVTSAQTIFCIILLFLKLDIQI